MKCRATLCGVRAGWPFPAGRGHDARHASRHVAKGDAGKTAHLIFIKHGSSPGFYSMKWGYRGCSIFVLCITLGILYITHEISRQPGKLPSANVTPISARRLCSFASGCAALQKRVGPHAQSSFHKHFFPGVASVRTMSATYKINSAI